MTPRAGAAKRVGAAASVTACVFTFSVTADCMSCTVTVALASVDENALDGTVNVHVEAGEALLKAPQVMLDVEPPKAIVALTLTPEVVAYAFPSASATA